VLLVPFVASLTTLTFASSAGAIPSDPDAPTAAYSFTHNDGIWPQLTYRGNCSLRVGLAERVASGDFISTRTGFAKVASLGKVFQIETTCAHAFGSFDLGSANDYAISIPVYTSTLIPSSPGGHTVCEGYIFEDGSSPSDKGTVGVDTIASPSGWSQNTWDLFVSDWTGSDASELATEVAMTSTAWAYCANGQGSPLFSARGNNLSTDTGGGYSRFLLGARNGSIADAGGYVGVDGDDPPPPPLPGGGGGGALPVADVCQITDVEGPTGPDAKTSGDTYDFRVHFTGPAARIEVSTSSSEDPAVGDHQGEDFPVPPASSPVEWSFTATETAPYAFSARCVSVDGRITYWVDGDYAAIIDEEREAVTACLTGVGFGLNPGSWVPGLLKAGACTARWMAVPTSGELQTISDQAGNHYEDSGLSAVGDVAGALDDGLDALGSGSSDCHGPTVTVGALGDLSVEPLSSCGGLSTMASVVKTGLAGLMIAATVLAWVRIVGGALGFNTRGGGDDE
jgi:hypothetical protein